MEIKLTDEEAEMLFKYNSLLYQVCYSSTDKTFTSVKGMLASEISDIWPNKQLKFI